VMGEAIRMARLGARDAGSVPVGAIRMGLLRARDSGEVAAR
jgi:hypothetical protein